MKRDDFPFRGGLPDAPLSMPKQALERDRNFLDILRSVFLVWQRR